ncbi:MAG: hypothetical protein ABII22_00330 [Candidatus Micrarchaeota archaeon]
MGKLIKKFEVIILDTKVEWDKVLDELKKNNFPREIKFTVFGDDPTKYRFGSMKRRVEASGSVWGEILQKTWGGKVPIPKKKNTVIIFDVNDSRIDWSFGRNRPTKGAAPFGVGDNNLEIAFVQTDDAPPSGIASVLWHEILHVVGAEVHLADETKMGLSDYMDEEAIKTQIEGFCKWLTANNKQYGGNSCVADISGMRFGAYWNNTELTFLWNEYATKSCVPGTYLDEHDNWIPNQNEFMAAMKKLPKEYLENYKKLSKLK